MTSKKWDRTDYRADGRMDAGLPPRIARLRQQICTAIPDRCPKCGQPIVRDGRRLACRPGGCGWDAFLIDARKPPQELWDRATRTTPARSVVDKAGAEDLG